MFYVCKPGKGCKPSDQSFKSDENLKSPCDTQVIRTAHTHLDLNKSTFIFERDDWVPGSSHLHRCGVFHLDQGDNPNYPRNKQIKFLNYRKAVNIISASPKNKYGQWWHITLQEADDYVVLEWVGRGPVGWMIVGASEGLHVHQLNKGNSVIHVLCTVRGIPGNPKGAQDFVATVDSYPLSPTYNSITNYSFGSRSGFEGDEGIEYHHGGLIEVDHQYFLAAGSLRWDNKATPLGGGPIDFHQILSKKNPNKTASIPPTLLSKIGACAIHTLRQDTHTGQVIATHLGTPGTGVDGGPARGPGGLIFIPTNFLFPSPPGIQAVKYYTIGDSGDPNEVGPSTIEGIPDNWVYDFDLNPCPKGGNGSTMVISSWGPPSSFDGGFNPALPYGRRIAIYSLPQAGGPTDFGNALNFIKRFDCNPVPQMGGPADGEGVVPLEVRRVHEPEVERYFVGITLPGAINLIFNDGSTPGPDAWMKKVVVSPDQLAADCASANLESGSSIPGGVPVWADVGNLKVPLVTDITLSEGDEFLYVACWLGGALLQYDVRDPFNPVYTGGVGNLGGVKKIAPGTNVFNTTSKYIKGKQFNGGVQMLRLSPDGRTIYVSNSLFSSWDKEFFPDGVGSMETNGCNFIAISTGVVDGVKTGPCRVIESFGISSDQLNMTLPDGSDVVVRSRMHEAHVIGISH